MFKRIADKAAALLASDPEFPAIVEQRFAALVKDEGGLDQQGWDATPCMSRNLACNCADHQRWREAAAKYDQGI